MSLRVASLAFAGAAVVAASAAHADGDKALGQFLSSECVTCHQITGRYEGIPPIVGWPKSVFIEIMGEYRAQKRANPIMQTIAVRLTEGEIAALAAYFGSLQPAN
jgi:cytochrome c553